MVDVEGSLNPVMGDEAVIKSKIAVWSVPDAFQPIHGTDICPGDCIPAGIREPAPEVGLTNVGGPVTGILKQVAHGSLTRTELRKVLQAPCSVELPAPERHVARQQGIARRCAGGKRGMGIREPHSLIGEGINIGRGNLRCGKTRRTDVPQSNVIRIKNHHIGFANRCHGRPRFGFRFRLGFLNHGTTHDSHVVERPGRIGCIGIGKIEDESR